MESLKENSAFMAQIELLQEVTGYLWEKGWAERNGGNISLNVTHLLTDDQKKLPAIAEKVVLEETMSYLAGDIFYVTGTGKRLRYVSSAPFDNGSLIRISDDGLSYEIIAEKAIAPTSELPSHLLMHNYVRSTGRDNKVVLHTHPTNIIALSHSRRFLDSSEITRVLWAMIPECRVIVPKGLGIVPYEVPGTIELARKTIKELERHDVVVWEKHGILAVGDDLIECFDAIDTLAKSADIYLCSRTAGFEPDGMSDQQLEELKVAFKL